MIKLHPEGGIQHIHPQLDTLQAAKPSLAALKPLWLTISAAATAAGPQAAASARGFVEEWMTDADLESAETAADLAAVNVLHLHTTQQRAEVWPHRNIKPAIEPNLQVVGGGVGVLKIAPLGN